MMSSVPYCFRAVETSFSGNAGSVTSPGKAETSPPFLRMPAADSSRGAASISLMSTRAPCAAKSSAVAWPMPLAVPVMMATLFSRSFIDNLFLGVVSRKRCAQIYLRARLGLKITLPRLRQHCSIALRESQSCQLLGGCKLRTDGFLAGPILLAQFFLQDLSRAGLREAFHEFNGARALIVRNARAAEFQQFGFCGACARLQHHQRLGHLAPLLVRNRDHRGFVNSSMGGKRFFQFERRDILASTHDDVLGPIDNEKIAIFIHRGHVAGVKPTAAQGLLCGLRLIPITLHHTVATSDDFADCFSIMGNIVTGGIDYTDFDATYGITGHRLVDMALFLIPLNTALHAREREHGSGFRKAVTGIAGNMQLL